MCVYIIHHVCAYTYIICVYMCVPVCIVLKAVLSASNDGDIVSVRYLFLGDIVTL